MKRLYIFWIVFKCVWPDTICYAQEFNVNWLVPPVIDGVDSISYLPKGHDSLLITWKKRLQGVVDREGTVVLKPEYNSLILYPGGWIEAHKGKAEYWFSESGRPLLDTLEKAVFIYGNYLVVKKNGKWGAIDHQGNIKMPLVYDRYVQRKTSFVFFKGTEETELAMTLTPEFPAAQRAIDEKARSFLPGCYLVIQNGKFGLLNARGDTVVPAIYHTFGSVHPDGLIVASLQPQLWGVIDKKHRTLRYFTAEGTGIWTKSKLLPIQENRKWALFRFPGNTAVIPFGKYEAIEVFDADKDWFVVTTNGKKGVINAAGKVLLRAEYEYVEKKSPRIAFLYNNRRMGYWVPSAGRREEPVYQLVKAINDTLCILIKDSTAAVVNVITGKPVIPFQKGYMFEKYGQFILSKNEQDGFNGRYLALYSGEGALLHQKDSTSFYIFSDRSFLVYSTAASPENTEHRDAKGQLLRTWKHNTVYHSAGTWIRLNPDYRNYSFFLASDPVGKEVYYDDVSARAVENIFLVKKGNHYGLITTKRKILAPPVLDAVLSIQKEYVRVKYQGKWGILENSNTF